MLPARHLPEIRGKVRADAVAQGCQGLAYGERATVLLAGQKQELRTVGGHGIEEDAHRSVGNAAEDQFVMAHQADGGAKGLAHFTDQGQAEVIHVFEMSIETGGDDTGSLADFTQADAAETSAGCHQLPCGFQEGLSGLQFLFGAREHGLAGFLGGQRCTLANRWEGGELEMDGAGRGGVALEAM